MTAFNTFNCLTTDMVLAKHNIGTSVYKVTLTNRAPVAATDAVIATSVEITMTNTDCGAGGATTTVTKSTAGAVVKVLASDVVITATGAVGPCTHAVL